MAAWGKVEEEAEEPRALWGRSVLAVLRVMVITWVHRSVKLTICGPEWSHFIAHKFYLKMACFLNTILLSHLPPGLLRDGVFP